MKLLPGLLVRFSVNSPLKTAATAGPKNRSILGHNENKIANQTSKKPGKIPNTVSGDFKVTYIKTTVKEGHTVRLFFERDSKDYCESTHARVIESTS